MPLAVAKNLFLSEGSEDHLPLKDTEKIKNGGDESCCIVIMLNNQQRKLMADYLLARKTEEHIIPLTWDVR